MNSTSSFPFLFHLCFISFLSLFCLFFISFLSLFYFFFINLSARRIFVHNYFLFLLYGGAQSPVTQHSPNSSYFFYIGVHNRQWHNIPLIFLISFILNPPPSSMVRSQNAGMWQTPHFCSIKVYYYLAGRFDSIFFLNWAMINFFLIEYYVRAYWISYVEFVL